MENLTNHDQRSRFEVYIKVITDYFQKVKDSNTHVYCILFTN